MAPKKKIASSHSPIQIGNCEVIVEPNRFTCDSDPNGIRISVPRNAKIEISVRKDLSNDVCQPKAEERVEEGRASTFEDKYMFVLVNSKDDDSNRICLLQEVLKLYMRELPTMSYAANTGKQSMFLERCVSNGKYSTLLLNCKRTEFSVEVIAAITYQIVPSDTKYAEVPLAAVSSIYQHKGFGHFLYMELRKRLQSVGIHTIYCWGDKESEGFWLKQGFTSIAEVDKRGKARRLPIKADIRKALCYPGCSTLMVSHLNKENSKISVDSLFFFPLKPHKNSLAIDASIEPGFTGEGYGLQKSQNHSSSSIDGSHYDELMEDGLTGKHTDHGDFSHCHDYGKSARPEGGEFSKVIIGAKLAKIGVDATTDVKSFSGCTPAMKRTWEASLSSLKSKKVKGSHQIDCDSNSIHGLDSENDRVFPCSDGCSLGISKSTSFVDATPIDPFANNCFEDCTKEGRLYNMTSEANKVLLSNGDCFRIMLMNIADDSKKRHLTKVIKMLGGIVTPNGNISTHIVTGKVRKTENFCTALCLGAWVVSSSWLKESSRNGKFVDELPYVLCDDDYVLKYRIELKDAVLRAKARPGSLFKGYNICIAAHVQPSIKTLSAIVRSAGGNIIVGLDKVQEESKTIFVACEEDMEEALCAAKKGIRTFGSDWLMNCIMRQELDLEALQFAESL